MIARFLGQFIDGTPGDRETVVSRIKARQAQQGFESEGGTEIARGTHILVRLNISSCTAEPTSKLVTWTGSIAKASFIITAPEELQNDLLIGSCTLSVNGMTVGHLAFDVPVRGGDEARAVYGGVVKHA